MEIEVPWLDSSWLLCVQQVEHEAAQIAEADRLGLGDTQWVEGSIDSGNWQTDQDWGTDNSWS
eukprot:COSAG04_NODE_12720_length_638_cov_1.029685_1_plen_62_part_10